MITVPSSIWAAAGRRQPSASQNETPSETIKNKRAKIKSSKNQPAAPWSQVPKQPAQLPLWSDWRPRDRFAAGHCHGKRKTDWQDAVEQILETKSRQPPAELLG